ncbi:hypothetical protein Sjap_003580 [Stephania japonica]|uniref:Glu S.griseus protease inhibitor n=1 Tax=Stephania japonica TaxID=461633 RepID=A0AAP0PV66_9MAGN
MEMLFCPGKQKWPELIGEQVSVAIATIHRENPYVQPIVVAEGTTAITGDLDCGRVRVWAEGGIVSRTPHVG